MSPCVSLGLNICRNRWDRNFCLQHGTQTHNPEIKSLSHYVAMIKNVSQHACLIFIKDKPCYVVTILQPQLPLWIRGLYYNLDFNSILISEFLAASTPGPKITHIIQEPVRKI